MSDDVAERPPATALRHRGACHCGLVRFAFTSPPITTGLRCNCSLCARRGAVMSSAYLALDQLEGRGALRLYRFGDRLVDHHFCGTCGVYPFHAARAWPELFRINLGCVEGLDLRSVTVTLVDGRSF